eukprot:COSAG02_NODE_18954_length_908_cov_3.991347_1_plen_169_part_10
MSSGVAEEEEEEEEEEEARQAEFARLLELARSDPEAAAAMGPTVLGVEWEREREREPEPEPEPQLEVDVEHLEQQRIMLLQQKLAQVRSDPTVAAALSATEAKVEVEEAVPLPPVDLAVQPPSETSQLVVDRDPAATTQQQHPHHGSDMMTPEIDTRDGTGGKDFFDGW